MTYLKSKDISLRTKIHAVKVIMCLCESCKEGKGPKNWCFWTVLLEKTFESLLDSKEIKPINPNGNQLWILIGRTDTGAPILWPCDAKGQLIGKDPNAGKNWGRKGKRVTEDEVVGWHHWFNGHEVGQTPKDGEGWGGLVCCSSGSCKESDMTWCLSNNNKWLEWPPKSHSVNWTVSGFWNYDGRGLRNPKISGSGILYKF